MKGQLGLSRPAKWKEMSGFEGRDRRQGYKAGCAAFARGRENLPPSLPEDSEWGQGYVQGFSAACVKADFQEPG